jgi:CBS-domain-containing membrane protein
MRVADVPLTWRKLAAELTLALPATATVLLVLFFVEELTRQRAVFASLAASAFLLYHDPAHEMNTLRAMVTSYLVAAALGIGAAWLFSPGYAAAAVALTLTMCLLIVLGSVHLRRWRPRSRLASRPSNRIQSRCSCSRSQSSSCWSRSRP